MSTHTSSSNEVTVRLARSSDSRQLLSLAALDSARAPEGPTLVAEVEGRIVAAVPLAGGRAIADPFRRTAHLVQVLELRAAQLRREADAEAAAPSGTRLAERIRRGMGERPVLRTP